MIIPKHDVMLVGAGPVSCTIAERLSTLYNLKCIIIEKRPHLAGNCYDFQNNKGLFVHKYGPHYFRTNNLLIIDYLKKFTKFKNANYVVKCYNKSSFYDLPININTLNKYFNKNLKTEKEAKKFLSSISGKYQNPKNSEQQMKNIIGKDLYELIYKNYTKKMWGTEPSKIPLKTFLRIPIRYNFDDRYFDEQYQVFPNSGYTRMFRKMTNSTNIKILYNLDYFKLDKNHKPNLFTIYTGPIDRFFNYKYGKLNWRSLDFKFETYKKNFYQPFLQVNYPNQYSYTRKVEIKHIHNPNNVINFTTISKEYPKENGDPYYPVNFYSDQIKFKRYYKLTKNLNSIFFIGRLAEYKYLNMDEVILRALDFVKNFKNLNV